MSRELERDRKEYSMILVGEGGTREGRWDAYILGVTRYQDTCGAWAMPERMFIVYRYKRLVHLLPIRYEHNNSTLE